MLYYPHNLFYYCSFLLILLFGLLCVSFTISFHFGLSSTIQFLHWIFTFISYIGLYYSSLFVLLEYTSVFFEMFKHTYQHSFESLIWKIFEVLCIGIYHYRICNFKRRHIVLDFRAVPGFVLELAHLELVGWVGCWLWDAGLGTTYLSSWKLGKLGRWGSNQYCEWWEHGTHRSLEMCLWNAFLVLNQPYLHSSYVMTLMWWNLGNCEQNKSCTL